MGSLGAEPVAVRKAEKPAQPQVGVGRNGAFASHDVADTLRRHTDLFRQSVLADPHRPQKFFHQEFAGRYGFELAHYHSPSVIVYDFHVFGSCLRPTETQPELIIDTDAVLPLAIASQGFQPITRRHPKIRQSSRDLQLPQLAPGHSRDVHKPPDAITCRKSPRVDALERLNHNPIVTGCVIIVNRD
jgi:hypothetical protein